MLLCLDCRICADYEVIAERALKEAETSDELMDMIKYIENARTAGVLNLNARVKVCFSLAVIS
jgi:dynein heavy chain